MLNTQKAEQYHNILSIIIYIYIYIYEFLVIGSKKEWRYFEMSRSTEKFVFFRIYLFILFLHTCMFPVWCFRQRTCMAQGLVNGIFNETWTHSCLQFEWFSVNYVVFYEIASFFFLECVSLSFYFTPHLILIFDTLCVCVCVCVLEWFRISLTILCVCVCVGVVSDFTNSYFFSVYVWSCVLSFFFCVYMYISMYVCFHVCVCVCVCGWFMFYLTLV